jgi:Xaa-Pro aminopeptidase
VDHFARRRRQLAKTIREAGVGLLVVNSAVNVTYLTGFTGDSSWLLVGPGRSLLVSDGRYTTQLKEECPGLDVHIRDTQQTIVQAVAAVLRKLGARNIGVEAAHLSLADMELLRGLAASVSWAPLRGLVENLRRIKDDVELVQIREAIKIAEKAYSMFCAMLRPQDSEKELADAMEGYVRRAGGRGTSFPTIVAVGDRSALPHAPVTGRTLAEASFLLLDWGAHGPLYNSDLTRIIVRGNGKGTPRRRGEKVASRLEKLYTIVLTAQKRALQAIRPGVKASDVDKAVRSYLEDVGFNEYFNHGLGHGIGLQVHEAPNLRSSSEDVLEAGMVFTVEPGVYLPGFAGVRIEDEVLVTPEGCEVLTTVAREPGEVF